MNKLLAIPALALGLAGCSIGGVSITAAALAAIVAHSQQACSDLMTLGNSVTAIATSEAATYPNDAYIQNIAAKVKAGVGTTNADCQKLAASFTAEAPKSLLTKEIKIDQGILDRIK
jgi:hypothetical protein